MTAARTGKAEVVAMLLRAGAVPTRKNKLGETAAAIARKERHEQVLKVLPPEDNSPFGSLFAAAKGFASSAASSAREIAEKAKQRSAAASKDGAVAEGPMSEEYEALLRKREERRRKEEAEKLAEAKAAKRKTVEAALLAAAEEEDLKLLRAIAERTQREKQARMAEQARLEEAARLEAAERRLQREAEEEAARLERDSLAKEKQIEEFKVAGNDAFRAGNYADAVAMYNRAIELDPQNPVLFSNRSGALAAVGEYTKALSDADMCIELRGEWSKGYTRRAAAMHGLKRFMAAVEAYEAAIEIEPDNETLRKGRRQSSFALAIE
uniref:Uncharacterized protein n=1 Tax=Chrysotila carterae TaxID=13221 RepID=A0A7S4FB75_CHRCT